jgi:hypothetical protein
VFEGQWDTVKKTKAQGHALGTIQIEVPHPPLPSPPTTIPLEVLPKYRQFGAPTVLKSGIQYIGIEIVEAFNLPATDENGLTDAYFVVEWEGMVQKTKVVQKTLSPVYRERLYFPVLLFEFSAEELAKKRPYVSIQCFDWDPDGSSDFQGSPSHPHPNPNWGLHIPRTLTLTLIAASITPAAGTAGQPRRVSPCPPHGRYEEFMIHEISKGSVKTQGSPERSPLPRTPS